ncbi:branched-chain amino acid ABC transporter permease [Alcaligenaceae bacterium B3P038]|nr:branched-chain amino acid ABC transporter permease [Alcaligenaceae bacterium B3P038]
MISYLAFSLTLAAVYCLMALGLTVIWGYTGMVNLGIVGFFAVGAYASAIVTTQLGLPIFIGWIAASIAAALAGVVLTYATRGLRGDYLAIVTLGFAETVRLVALNEQWLTRGAEGISGIPGPFKAQLGSAFNIAYLIVAWVIAGYAAWSLARLDKSPFGRVLRAIRDDDLVARVAGKNVVRFKLIAFAIGSALAGLAGALYAHFTSYFAPDIIAPLLTIYVFLAATAGGNTRPMGAIVGSLVVMLLLEGSRIFTTAALGLPAVQAAALRDFIIAAALIVILQLRPKGLLPERIRPAPRAK